MVQQQLTHYLNDKKQALLCQPAYGDLHGYSYGKILLDVH
jgi:hypothetical protein